MQSFSQQTATYLGPLFVRIDAQNDLIAVRKPSPPEAGLDRPCGFVEPGYRIIRIC